MGLEPMTLASLHLALTRRRGVIKDLDLELIGKNPQS